MTGNFAVIGHPIGHTMSPFIHKKLFSLKGIDVQYSALDIYPSSLSDSIFHTLSSLDGFNVTIPHKEAIIPLLSGIDESAQKYNAVNCVRNDGGKLYGCSTDAYGFTKALEANGVSLSGDVLILGAGGAARTLAREASDNGCHLTIAVRSTSIEKANELKSWLSANGGKAEVTSLDKISGRFNLCVNATPVGMYPNTDNAAVGTAVLSKCSAVFDAVYNPNETKLLKLAKSLGLKCVGGMEMLVWQAVKAHEFWYNAKFSADEVSKIIIEANVEMERIFYAK